MELGPEVHKLMKGTAEPLEMKISTGETTIFKT